MTEIEPEMKKLKIQDDINDRKIKKVPLPIATKPKHDEIFKKDKIDTKLLKKHFLGEGKLEKEHVLKILLKAKSILSKEPNLLRLTDPITVVGDIHGQYYDLVGIFEMCGEPSENNSFFFMGDYVDRGYFGIECVILLLAFKINFPNNIYLIRGNHECRHITKYFNFFAECLHKYDEEVYDEIMKTFDCLPLAATINYMFCVHGGISPKLVNIQDINSIDRFVEIPSIGPMCDLLWSDPMSEADEENATQNQMFIPNTQRNASYKYSYNAVSVFLKANNLLCILRAHEAEEKGYKFYKAIEKTGFPSVITVFSAPNYCFSRDTKIYMSNGTQKSIQDIKKLDYVLGPDSKPRKVIEVFQGKDYLYKVTQNTKHQDKTKEIYGRIEFTCNSRHKLIVKTPNNVYISQRNDKWRIYWSQLDFEEVEDENGNRRQIQMVKQKSETILSIEKEKKMNEKSKIKQFEWEIEARDVKLMGFHVRNSTFQEWAPILIENKKFRNTCLKMELPKDHITKVAWLSGCWIGDGVVTKPLIAINKTDDPDEVQRIIEYAEIIGLSPNIEEQSLSKIGTKSHQIKLNSTIPYDTTKQCLTTNNAFWEVITEYGLIHDGEKSIPIDFSSEEINIREWFLAGMIDSDGHVIVRDLIDPFEDVQKTNGIVRVEKIQELMKEKELLDYYLDETPRSLKSSIKENGIIKKYERVEITTIYPKIRDGLISLVKSLGIHVSVTVNPEYNDKNCHHQVSYAIKMSSCSALSNILSKCSIARKRCQKPEKVTYETNKFYFEIHQLFKKSDAFIEKKIIDTNSEDYIDDLTDEKIKDIMDKHNLFGKSYQKLATFAEKNKIDIKREGIRRWLKRESQHSPKSRDLCNILIKENWILIKNEIEKDSNTHGNNFKKIKLDFNDINCLDDLDDKMIRKIMIDYNKFNYSLKALENYSVLKKCSIDGSNLSLWLRGRTKNSLNCRQTCLYVIKENWDQINGNIKDYFMNDEPICDEYYGFELEESSDHKFLLANNAICRNCDTYNNAGAVLQFINNDMNVKQFKCLPHPMVLPSHQNVFTWSIPFVSEKVCDIMYGILSQCPLDEEDSDENESVVNEETINSIRAKIVSMGKVSKMYNTIKQERESWLILKGMLLKSGKRHHLLLTQGPDAITKAIESFEGAKSLDDDSRPNLGKFVFSDVKAETQFNTSPSSTGSGSLSPSKEFSEKDSPSIKLFKAWVEEMEQESKK